MLTGGSPARAGGGGSDLTVGTRVLTVKLGLPGWIRSSASTQMPLVNFRDW